MCLIKFFSSCSNISTASGLYWTSSISTFPLFGFCWHPCNTADAIRIQDIPKTIAALFLLIFSPSSQVYFHFATPRYIKYFVYICIITYHYAFKNSIVFDVLFQNAIFFYFFVNELAFWYISVAIHFQIK